MSCWDYGTLVACRIHGTRTSISNSAPRGVITYDLAYASCMNEEVRRKSINFDSSSKSDLLLPILGVEILLVTRRIMMSEVSQEERMQMLNVISVVRMATSSLYLDR